jgi:hypothetical protein
MGENAARERLAGSRFIACAMTFAIFILSRVWPKPATNRRLPGVTQRSAALPDSWKSILANGNEALGQNIALGSSREPPVYPFSGPNRDTTNTAIC